MPPLSWNTFLKPFCFKKLEAFSQRIPPVQNIATLLLFLSLLKYFGNSLKLFILGFTAPSKVPTLCSKGFLTSINVTLLSLINLFHLLGST